MPNVGYLITESIKLYTTEKVTKGNWLEYLPQNILFNISAYTLLSGCVVTSTETSI